MDPNQSVSVPSVQPSTPAPQVTPSPSPALSPSPLSTPELPRAPEKLLTEQKTPPTHKSSIGALVGIVIIILVLIVGALYFWGAKLAEQDADMSLMGTDETMPVEDVPGEDLSAEETAAEEALLEESAGEEMMDNMMLENTGEGFEADPEFSEYHPPTPLPPLTAEEGFSFS